MCDTVFPLFLSLFLPPCKLSRDKQFRFKVRNIQHNNTNPVQHDKTNPVQQDKGNALQRVKTKRLETNYSAPAKSQQHEHLLTELSRSLKLSPSLEKFNVTKPTQFNKTKATPFNMLKPNVLKQTVHFLPNFSADKLCNVTSSKVYLAQKPFFVGGGKSLKQSYKFFVLLVKKYALKHDGQFVNLVF